jgi:hypothetical protein
MVYIRDLLSDDARKSERNAVERAAWRLVAAGRIEIRVFAFGRPRLLATRPNFPIPGRPPRARVRPLSVGEVPLGNSAHAYSDFTMKVAAKIGGQWSGYRHTRHTSARTT